MTENQQQQPQITLTNQQIAQAAGEVLKLLNDDERVSIPPSMARSGSLVIMDKILQSLVNGEVVMANPDMLKPEAIKTPDGDEGTGED